MAKRGPSYPAFGLKEAIERVRQLHRQDGSAPTAPDVAIRAWGYGSLNGASLRVLAALKQYGLIEATGDNVRVTERALAILLEPEGSVVRQDAIRDAANAPLVFSTIMAEYQGALPSDAAIVSYLVRKQGFQEQPAQKLVEAFRETVELAKESSAPQITENDTGTADVSAAISRSGSRAMATAEVKQAATGSEGERMEFIWPLSGDAKATMSVTRTLDADDIPTLEAYFKTALIALKKASLRRPVEAPAAPGPVTGGVGSGSRP